jgi:GNAT superfamily N-acetyltransferase
VTAADPSLAPSDDRSDLVYRPARTDELAACADIWRVSINDYIGPLGQPELPTDQARLLRLYGHLQATDPERFVVAVTQDPEAPHGERIIGFAAAVQRERLWFLSMCFVLPEAQGRGVGRALLAATGPTTDVASDDGVRATATDAVQPISNALYASLGIVPRVPLLDLIGHPMRPAAFGSLPPGIRPVSFEELAGGAPGSTAATDGHASLASAVDALDRATLGVAHPMDHRFLRQDGRRGWLYHGPDGQPIAYGYVTEAGRVGPVATLDDALLAPILGHLTSAVTPRGAFAMWLPGTADRALVAALQAGFRLDQFPVLLCWDRPFADLTRYLPISPGLP